MSHPRGSPWGPLWVGTAYSLGLLAAVRVAHADLRLAVALGCAALALGRRGTLVVALSLGAAVGIVRGTGANEMQSVDLHRFVTVSGRLDGCWTEVEDGVRGVLRLRSIEQKSDRPRPSHRRLLVYVAGQGGPEGCDGTWRARGLLRGPKQFRNIPQTRTGRWYVQVKSGRLVEEVGSRSSAAGPMERWRRALRSRATSRSSLGAGLAHALVLGDVSPLPHEWVSGFRRLGVGHLLAVSGLHVSLVIVLGVVSAAWLPTWGRRGVAAIPVLLYAGLVGPRASLVRAILMAGVAGTAALLRRPAAARVALVGTVAAMLSWDPGWITDLGFQLSVAATTGIVTVGPALRDRMSMLPHWLATGLAVTLAAQLGTLPWSLTEFARISAVSPVVNLVGTPWLMASLGLGLAWAVAVPCSPLVAGLVERPLNAVAKAGALLPDVPLISAGVATVSTSSSTAWVVTAFLVGAIAGGPTVRRICLAAIVAAAAIAVVMWRPQPQEVGVIMLDVGQGEAVVLVDGRHGLLIDGGGWRRPGIGDRLLRPVLHRAGIRSLWAFVASHSDRDHCTGLAELAEVWRPDEVWFARGDEDSWCARSIETGRGVPLRSLSAGDSQERGRWTIEVLGPRDEELTGARSQNDGSLVIRAEAEGRSVLLTGDIGRVAEGRLGARWGSSLRSDILKVAHHGSKTSTSALFLNAVRPRLSLVSAGSDNPYGHPAAVVLDRLRDAGVPVFRTDRQGMIAVRWRAGGPLRITVQAP